MALLELDFRRISPLDKEICTEAEAVLDRADRSGFEGKPKWDFPLRILIRQVGIWEQTLYRWKKTYAGLESIQVREFKQLSDENGRLKKLVVELSLAAA